MTKKSDSNQNKASSKSVITRLKALYIKYYSVVPIQKYAAMSVGRDEDTIIRWKREDADFADSVQIAKAKYVKEMFSKVKPEFALQKLDKEVFNSLEGYSEQKNLTIEFKKINQNNIIFTEEQKKRIKEKEEEAKKVYLDELLKATMQRD